MPDRALIVFAKSPTPGKVKTRLAASLGAEAAARLYRAFVSDSLAQYASLGVAVRLYVTPSVEDFPRELVPAPVSLHLQQGGGLGERMLHAFVESFAAGHEEVVIIGTDHPSLPSEFISLAFESIEPPMSVCLGPSEDGGYYLLGMNDLYPGAFTGMKYSHPGVFGETLVRLEQTNASVTILPAWYDVDDVESLSRLVSDLQHGGTSAPATRRALNGLGLL